MPTGIDRGKTYAQQKLGHTIRTGIRTASTIASAPAVAHSLAFAAAVAVAVVFGGGRFSGGER